MDIRKYFRNKKLSAGLVLTDGNVFLAVRPTGQRHYDIPKGIVEKGEKPIDALMREVKEETGLDIEQYRDQLEDKGRFQYIADKDVQIFLLQIEDLPDLDSMRCTSTFDFYGTKLPEVDSYKYINNKNITNFRLPMEKVLSFVLLQI